MFVEGRAESHSPVQTTQALQRERDDTSINSIKFRRSSLAESSNMFKNKLKSLAGGKKSKSKAAAGGAELANESETLAYSDVREKDLPKFLLACWQGDIGQVTKSLKKKLLVADTLYKGR